MRVSLAFIGATIAPCLFLVLVLFVISSISDGELKPNEFYILTVAALCVSAGHVLVLGVPSFLLYTRFKSISFIGCISGAFFLASIPAMFYSWPYRMVIGNGSFSSGGNVLVDHGQLTVYAWLNWLQGIITMGLFGFVGGLVFWALYKRLS